MPSFTQSPNVPHANSAGQTLPRKIAVVEGEGIGPEVIAATLEVLGSVNRVFGSEIALVHSANLVAKDEFGLTIDPAIAKFYEAAFIEGVPVLHGPAGGRYVYDLRAKYDLAVKLTPVKPMAELADASVVRPERLTGVDVLIVRDNSAGLYQGNFGWHDQDTAFHEATYTRNQTERVLTSAIEAAQNRNGRLAVVTKPGGIPAISALWKQSAQKLAPNNLEVEFIEIDNACFQLVSDPKRFDVVATPNMFGDVVGDTATLVLGSRGVSYSANFGPNGRAVYQTAHGAAHDLAGQNVANPIAQILTAAWLLRESLGLKAEAAAIQTAVRETVAAGLRTKDIAAANSIILSTSELAAEISSRIRKVQNG
ncbi:MAG: hypothetical protein RL556_408 [Actinomycetota bacterium]|jgi:3-isopropylmalate dehydrogenase